LIIILNKTMEITEEQKRKINMIAILEDLQDQFISELQPDLRQGMRHIINRAATHTKQFIKYCDRVFQEDNQEAFGDTADEIRKILDEIYLD